MLNELESMKCEKEHERSSKWKGRSLGRVNRYPSGWCTFRYMSVLVEHLLFEEVDVSLTRSLGLLRKR